MSSVSARSHVLLAFWTVVLFNLPFWWYSTSIERLPLPVLSDSDRLALEAFARSASQAQDRQARDGRVTKYAPHWRLAFTLLLEDIVDGSPPLAWEIESGIADVFSPLLEALEQFHTFSIESSIQYHAPLLVTPVQDNSSSGWLVGADDAKAFVNSEAWSLGSYGVIDEPTLQFMVFVPRASRSPLAFERTAGGSSRSILIPQQGSLVIHTPPPDAASRTLSRSDLHPVLQTHLQALSTLLGIPSSSSSSSSSGPLSSSQLSTLLRQRSAENIIEATQALSSLTRLIDKISEMRVGPMVQEAVKGSVTELEAIARSLSSSSSTPTSLATLQAIFSHSARALQLSSSAFFHPSMLGLLYFPDEHKYAVYTPLFAPVGVPLVVALVKEIKRRKKEKRERKKAASEKEKVDGAATTAGRIDAVPI